MVRFDRPSGNLAVTDVGRTAPFYILHESVDVYNTLLRPHMTETSLARFVFQRIRKYQGPR